MRSCPRLSGSGPSAVDSNDDVDRRRWMNDPLLQTACRMVAQDKEGEGAGEEGRGTATGRFGC